MMRQIKIIDFLTQNRVTGQINSKSKMLPISKANLVKSYHNLDIGLPVLFIFLLLQQGEATKL